LAKAAYVAGEEEGCYDVICVEAAGADEASETEGDAPDLAVSGLTPREVGEDPLYGAPSVSRGALARWLKRRQLAPAPEMPPGNRSRVAALGKGASELCEEQILVRIIGIRAEGAPTRRARRADGQPGVPGRGCTGERPVAGRQHLGPGPALAWRVALRKELRWWRRWSTKVKRHRACASTGQKLTLWVTRS
jgi:hypothetical protein